MKDYIIHKKADDSYVLSLACNINDDEDFCAYDGFITDGDISELTYYESTDVSHNYFESGNSTETLTAVSIISVTNASFTIIQKINNCNVKFAVIRTLLTNEDTLDELSKISYTLPERDITMPYVRKIKLK